MIDDRLPNAAAARVDTRKLGEYLLNPAHPDNGGKAAFFLALGFARSDVEPLRFGVRQSRGGRHTIHEGK